MLLFGLKANSFCSNTTIEMTSFSISINRTIGTNEPLELTYPFMYVEVNRSANGLSAWIGDDLLSVFFPFFFEEGHRQNVPSITKTIAPLACRQALQLKWCTVKPLYFDRAPFQRRSPFPGYRALDSTSTSNPVKQESPKLRRNLNYTMRL